MPITLNSLIKLNGSSITEHNRKYSYSLEYKNEQKILLSGKKRRYLQPAKKIFDFSWSYLPDKAAQSIDGLPARDFIYNLVHTSASITLGIQESSQDNWHYYTCIVSDFSENIIKIDIPNQCRYYDVNLKLVEI